MEMPLSTVERDPHRCAWGPRCVNPDIREINPETNRAIRRGAVITDGPLCAACLDKLRMAVKGLPRDYQRISEAIGERRPADGAKVARTAAPEIPINPYREMLLARIVDLADRAADIVECELHMTGKNRRRGDQPAVAGRGYAAVRESKPDGATTVDRAVSVLLPTLDVLVESGKDWHMVWAPIPDGDKEWDRYEHGQPRDIVELDGLDVALQIVDLSRAVYDEMGLARLRHHEPMPCPAVNHTGKACGAYTVGRNDGRAEYDCTTCGAVWPEREYDWLVGRVLDEIQEQEEMKVLTYLLGEAYWRLDTLRIRLEALRDVDLVALLSDPSNDPAQVMLVIIEQLGEVLSSGISPHPTPEERHAATDPSKKEKHVVARAHS